ncbi:MAG: hypothetical protein U9O90_03410 [Euryarchaeota archaeon]|nr:hypothetical protein [Euryarchaeota archaeon]
MLNIDAETLSNPYVIVPVAHPPIASQAVPSWRCGFHRSVERERCLQKSGQRSAPDRLYGTSQAYARSAALVSSPQQKGQFQKMSHSVVLPVEGIREATVAKTRQG